MARVRSRRLSNVHLNAHNRGIRTSTDALNGDSLRTLRAWRQRLLGRVQAGVEEGVNERGLAEPRLA